MSVSIYYSFKSKIDVGDDAAELQREWDEAFDGEPYESWTWYEVENENGIYKYEGSTSLPMDEETGMQSVLVATTLLSNLRIKVGGTDWSVNLDDMEFPWDDQSQSYTPNF